MQALIRNVAAITGHGAVYTDIEARKPVIGANVCGFCRHCLEHPATASFCRYAYCSAALQSMASGEPFFSQCWAGLLFVAMAVAPENVCRGGLSIGGFFSLGDEHDIRETVRQRLEMLPEKESASFLSRLDTIQRVTPSALRGLGLFLMEATYSSGLSHVDYFILQNEKYRQQREIAEAAADMRHREPAPPNIVSDTYQLVLYLERRDREGARKFISQYLAKLLMASNWDLTRLKAHLRVLLAVMTSQAILKGVPWEAAVNRELRHMNLLEKAGSTEESCFVAAEMIQQYIPEEDGEPDEHGPVSERVQHWLQRHYAEPVSVAAAARAVGVSASTLAHRLRRESGRTFRQLVLDVRVAEARRLLATTTLKISDVAERCGFADQSHFTKALSAATNLTPGRFRKLLRLTPEEVLRDV